MSKQTLQLIGLTVFVAIFLTATFYIMWYVATK